MEVEKFNDFLQKVKRQSFIDSEEVCGSSMIDIDMLEGIIIEKAQEVWGYFLDEQ